MIGWIRKRWRAGLGAVCAVTLVMGFATGVYAFDSSLTAQGADEDLTETLTKAAASLDPVANNLTAPPQILAAALADYRTILQILYDRGYFSPEVSIKVDGREAVEVLARELGSSIGRIAINVDIGPKYKFGALDISPVLPDTELPEDFVTGKTATTGAIGRASRAAVNAWRDAGHAKAQIADQSITANHATRTLTVKIQVSAGPELRFGKMTIASESGVSDEAIYDIAGFPTGKRYSPAAVKKSVGRLQRTGAFAAVTLAENATPNDDGTIDFVTTVVDQKLRRLSLGGEISSRDGLDLSAVWTHRNLTGSADSLRLEGRIRNIGGQENLDGLATFRYATPAKLGPNVLPFYAGGFEVRNEEFYQLRSIKIGWGLRRIVTDDFNWEFLGGPIFSTADDAFGDGRTFDYLLFPVRAEQDKRNDTLNPTNGYFVQATARPMVGYRGTTSAFGLEADARLYLGLFADRLVLAGRAKLGTTYGAEIEEISPEFLYYSGGAGTVRGQPYEELGVPVNGGTAGGRSTLIINSEVRARVTDSISLVGFYDWGAVDAAEFITTNAPSHAGTGVGVRYLVPGIGPLRADLAWPTLGNTGEDLQIYLGIGQAF